MENDEYEIMHHLEGSYWWFIGKQFLVKQILNRVAKNNPGQGRALDIGCGTGIILKLLKNHGMAYGMEFSTEAIRFLKQRNLDSIVKSDANLSIPFKDDTFSVITCLDVLEHLENDLGLMEEMLRVCKPGGKIIITVPAFNMLWSPHDEALHHRRRYTRQEILEKTHRFNCSVVKCSYYNTALFLPILTVRKFKRAAAHQEKSDFFMPIPSWINSFLILLFVSEIRCLDFVDFPFGVSLLLILKKPGVS